MSVTINGMPMEYFTLDAKVRSRCEKLSALAERGCGGERDVAAKVLTALLKQHGWTREEFDARDSDPRVPHEFSYAKQRDCNLIAAIARAVLESNDTIMKERGRRSRGGALRYTHLVVECTAREAAQIRALTPVFIRALDGAEEDLFVAFLAKNQLHGPFADEPRAPLSDEERAQRARVAAIAQGIDSTPRHRAIAATSVGA